MTKEEQLYVKLVNQTSEFRDKHKRMEDELHASTHASELTIQRSCKVHVTMHLCTCIETTCTCITLDSLASIILLCFTTQRVMHLH